MPPWAVAQEASLRGPRLSLIAHGQVRLTVEERRAIRSRAWPFGRRVVPQGRWHSEGTISFQIPVPGSDLNKNGALATVAYAESSGTTGDTLGPDVSDILRVAAV